MSLPKSIQNLTHELNKLPGIGPRTAARFALYLLKSNPQDLEKLISALKSLKQNTKLCSRCFNITDASSKLCSICQDPKRNLSQICVVESPLDVSPIEATGQYKGLYHILGGTISPTRGRNPKDLKIKELVLRLQKENIKEIILATDPTTEGETTAMYLARVLKPYKINPVPEKSRYRVKITRLARGLPTGADLKYADEATLSSALSGRREIN